MTPEGSSMPYPRALRDEVLAWAIAQIERFLPAGPDPLVPFAHDEQVPVVFRFPSPRGLLSVLGGRAFTLTPPDVEAAFAGDLATSFDYPWVRELGTLALLDPIALSFYKVRARPGWFACDGAQIAEAVFVPERAMGERLEAGMKPDQAVEAMGPEYAERTREIRARSEEYMRELPAIDARCRELLGVAKLHPDGVRLRLEPHGLSLAQLEAPLFTLSREQRRALLDLR
ncbi:MAG: hypothetical protein ACXWUG_20995 [Polyangiales bacterium]